MRLGSDLKGVVNSISSGDRLSFESVSSVGSLCSVLLPLSKYLTFLILTGYQDVLSCKSSKRVTTNVSFSFLNFRSLLYRFIYLPGIGGSFINQIFFFLIIGKYWLPCFYSYPYSLFFTERAERSF